MIKEIFYPEFEKGGKNISNFPRKHSFNNRWGSKKLRKYSIRKTDCVVAVLNNICSLP